MKSSPQMPPPVDTAITEKTDKAEAALEKEKKRLLDGKSKGMAGTILTSGMGVEEEANTGTSLLGGTLE
tara:strand:+ start:1285 stop:1491 length:207 start_codon:yes stop_codon:yes gene_type:complete